MTEDRYRHLFREGFAPMLEPVPPGPNFDDFAIAAPTPAPRVPAVGWTRGIAAAAAVLALGVLAVITSPLGRSGFDAVDASDVGVRWWSAVIDSDTGTVLSLTHPESDFDLAGAVAVVDQAGRPTEVSVGTEAFGTRDLPQLCYTLIGPGDEQQGSLVFQRHESDWLVREIRTGAVACSGLFPVTTTTAPAPTTTAGDPNAACVPGLPRPGIDLQSDAIIEAYNGRSADTMVRLIGDGPVLDPSLEPATRGTYPSVAAWLAAAETVGDQLASEGYSMGEPFSLILRRANPSLAASGIEDLSVLLNLWVNQDCEWRVEGSGDVVSAPDACLYHFVYRPDELPVQCAGPFSPRGDHVAVWTGEEVLIYGGYAGVRLTSGLGFNPETGLWRDLSPSPHAVDFWWRKPALWTGEEMVVAGRVDGHSAPVLQVYSPAIDRWRVASPLPDDRLALGAMVWTGEELVFVGGDNLYPDSSAWSYDPRTDIWRALPDPGIPDVEGIEGVWTGTEAIFIGGYAFLEPAPAVAYDPRSNSWRQLSDSVERWMFLHHPVWTGQHVILYSGHTGPGHRDRLLLYDPSNDRWSESSVMPITPRERLAGAWVGDRLIVWGGYSTYGDPDGRDADGDWLFGDGALYDPETDTWTVLPDAPLSDRCDHTGTWTGEVFVVFGGSACGELPPTLPHGDAAAYHPERNEWTLLTR